MNTQTQSNMNDSSAHKAEERVKTLNWERISQDLDAQGSVVLERLITLEDCQRLFDLFICLSVRCLRLLGHLSIIALTGYGVVEYFH